MTQQHPPANRFIGYGRQTIEQADIDAVVETLTGDFLTQGPVVARFEQALAGYAKAAQQAGTEQQAPQDTAERRSAAGSAMQQLRSSSTGG